MTPSNLILTALARRDVIAPAEVIEYILAIALSMNKEIDHLRKQVVDLEAQFTYIMEG